MNDDIFSEISAQLRPAPGVRARLLEAIDAEPAPAAPTSAPTPPPPHVPRPRRWLAWVAAAAAVTTVGLAALPTLIPRDGEISAPRVVPAPPSPAPPAAAVVDPDDYAQTYDALQEAFAADPMGGFFFANSGRMSDTAAGFDAAVPAAASAEAGTWGTNTQVAGIDEGDVVKSDGRTIFTASGNDVVLVSADGAATTEVARIDTTAPETGPTEGTVQGPVIDLMLHDDTLVALVTEYTPRASALPASQSMAYVPYDASQTRALLYDVTDPSSPRFVTSVGQSGAYATSRLSGDLLYLVTSYDVADRDAVDSDDPSTFVPLIADGRAVAPVPAPDLTIPAEPSGPAFQVISSVDLSDGQRVDTAAVMGRASITYMGHDNLFLGSSTYQSTPAAEFTLDQATGLSQISQTTELVRVELADGEVTVAAQASIPGMPLNQFALDEFDGHLRVAVTMDGTTDSGGWATYPTLFVLDDSLNVVSSLPQLAVNEQIQSVRFEGPIAYVVTFERVDPLFALDLSDPTDPKIMSELKIPGFSTYLHPWADGRLLGLGVDATEQGQMVGLKLSMYDTSDPYDVTEVTTLKVPFHQAEALRNHKAVFIDLDRGLIGFAVETYTDSGQVETDYLLHRYDDEAGFTALGELPVQQSSTVQGTTARAMTIGADLYVVTPAGIDVYRTDSLNELTSQHFNDR